MRTSPCLLRDRAPGPRAGVALTAALVAVITIAAFGAYLMQAQATMTRRQALSIDTRTALYTAEAGLAEAAFQVSQGRTGAIGSPEQPAGFNGNKYWVVSEEHANGDLTLTSTGLAGRSRFRVSVTVVPNQNPVTRLGVFGDEGVVIGDRVVIDGYDASVARFAASLAPGMGFETTAQGALVGSNGDIIVDEGVLGTDPFPAAIADFSAAFPAFGPLSTLLAIIEPALWSRYQAAVGGTWPDTTAIFGEATPGSEGVLLTNGGVKAVVEGKREFDVVLPEVIVPAGLPARGSLDVAAGPERVVENVSVALDEVRVRPGAIFTIRGPAVFVVGTIHVERGGCIKLDDNAGPISIFVTDELRFDEDSMIAGDGEDEALHGVAILVQASADPADDQRVTFACGGDMRGLIYAPGDRVSLPATLRLYGSVVAKHVTLEDGAWVSVDESLTRGACGAGFPSLPKRMRWQAVAMGDSAAATEAARAAAADADAVDDALPEQDLEMLYMDGAGERVLYSGSFAAFDRSLAERIVAVRWRKPDATFTRWTQPAGASPDDVIARWREQLREVRADAGP